MRIAQAAPSVSKQIGHPSSDGRTGSNSLADARYQVLGLMRDIRVHSQDAQRSLAIIKNAQADWDAVLTKSREGFERNKTNVQNLLTQIRTVHRSNPELYNEHGDEISRVGDLWERIIQEWPRDPKLPNDVLHKAVEVESLLRDVVCRCGFVTIPPRVNEHLVGLRVGQALDFHKNFTDELPDKSDRDEILKYLRDHPMYLNGITDAEHGVIYRSAFDRRARYWSFARIIILVSVGVGLVWFACRAGDILGLQNWPLQSAQLRGLMVAYLFVLLGGLFHVFIAAFKQARSGKEQPIAALEDMILWVHVKEMAIMGGIVSLWFGLFGLAFLGKAPEWQTAFFVGYGIDSIVDVVLKRFEAAVPKTIS